jgi:hypothetical protein
LGNFAYFLNKNKCLWTNCVCRLGEDPPDEHQGKILGAIGLTFPLKPNVDQRAA